MNIDKIMKKKTVILTSLSYCGFSTLLFLFVRFKVSGLYECRKIIAITGDVYVFETFLGDFISFSGWLNIILYFLLITSLLACIYTAIYYVEKDKTDYIMLGQSIVHGLRTFLLFMAMPLANACRETSKLDVDDLWFFWDYYEECFQSMEVSKAIDYFQYHGYLTILIYVFVVIVVLIAVKLLKFKNISYSFEEGEPFRFDMPAKNTNPQVNQAPRFDPKTGQPVNNGVRFDPKTGQPVNNGTRFDPKTGKPL